MKHHRQLAAIMFTDMEGYTALMQKNETEAIKARKKHRQIFDSVTEKFNGQILQYYGDGTLSIFDSAIEAVNCSIEMQLGFQKEPIVPVRIGIHIGDIVHNEDEIIGDGVNVAARIESLGVAGSILLSEKLNDELKNHQSIITKSLGQFDLKNVAEPVEIFAISNKGVIVPEANDLKGKLGFSNKTIAVLPFANMSTSKENEYFSDGITEEIINALAKIKNLKVTSRTSSFFFKNKNIPITKIGKELGVSTILEGSVRLSGNMMRITAQLIDVKEDFHFWSETFDRSLDDIFAVQDEVSLLIADKLREHVGHFDIQEHLVEAPQIPIDTYKLYLKGKYYIMKLDLQGTEKGIAIMEEVIAKQPDFALAYLSVNQGYAYLGTMGMIPADEGFVKGKPFLDKALELDENLPESQVNLAWISAYQHWDLESAYKHVNKALDIRPADHMYLTVSNLLLIEGKFEAALNYIDKALALDPFSPMNHHFKGFIFYNQEKYDKAIPYFEKSLSLNSGLHFPKLSWGHSLLLMGKAQESLDFFQKLEDDTPSLVKLGGITLAQIALGQKNDADTGIKQLETYMQTGLMGSAMNYLIYGHTMLGDYKKSIELVEQGIGFRLPLMMLLATEPLVKPLHSNPRFKELMKQILGEKTSFGVSSKKYKKSPLKPELLKGYQEKLNVLMQEKEPYLDAGLTLRKLAEMLEIPVNQVSQLLNEGFDKNFAEYVNSYRVEAFKTKAADIKQQHLTLLALAYNSGFNSKTVFNTFFKKMEGKTPKQFWKEAVK